MTAGPLTPNILPPMPGMALTPNSAGVVIGPGGQILSPGLTPVSAVGAAKLGMTQGGTGLKGYHPLKTWSYSRRNGQLYAPGSKYVKNRRMNWANGKAMGRAERRINSFVKHAARYIRMVHPSKGGRVAPKFARRSKR
jgi:hypothetical protein